MKSFILAGTGTGIGKTFVAAVLTEALRADYWKPVQAGHLENSDTDIVRSLVTNSRSFFHPETYRLKTPVSPHAAARMDQTEIDLEKIILPVTGNRLIIEPPGGVMVPLTDRLLNIHLFKKWELPVVLVSKNYLGSINHTLLSVEALKNQQVPVSGIIFNGIPNPASEKVILEYTQLTCIARIDEQKEVNQQAVTNLSRQLEETLQNFFQ